MPARRPAAGLLAAMLLIAPCSAADADAPAAAAATPPAPAASPTPPAGPVKQTAQMKWPTTPAGQKQFLDDLVQTVRATQNHRGIGVCWWYPEALPIQGHNTWEGGALGWFDESGNLLPAMNGR